MQTSLFHQLGFHAQPWGAAALPQLVGLVAPELKGKKASDDRLLSVSLDSCGDALV